MINQTGWIKLHRQLLDSQVFVNSDLLKVWLWCMLRANHQSGFASLKTGRGFTEVKVADGQFVYGRKSAALQLGMPEGSVDDRMKKLAQMGNLHIKPSRHYSIVTLCNWNTYQSLEIEKQQPTPQASNTQATPKQQASNTQATPKQQASNTQATQTITIKNEENENNEDNSKKDDIAIAKNKSFSFELPLQKIALLAGDRIETILPPRTEREKETFVKVILHITNFCRTQPHEQHEKIFAELINLAREAAASNATNKKGFFVDNVKKKFGFCGGKGQSGAA